MRDRRPVDELSIEELERILVIRRREARQQRLQRYQSEGRRLPMPDVVTVEEEPPAPQQHEAAADLPPVEPPVTYDLTDDVPRFEDEVDEDYAPRKPRPRPAPADEVVISRGRRVWDRVLLAVEVIAVVGLIGVLAGGIYLVAIENDRIDELNQKSARIQQEAAAMIPTPTPQPDLRVSVYVLPGGHYSPDETGGVPVFNYDELPDSVRPAIAAQLAVPQVAAPTPDPSSPGPGRVVIPAINVDANIYEGDDWFALQKGVGHYKGSANPGERGNMVLTAHNDIYGEIFRDIQKLEPGDEIQVWTRNGQRSYTYIVREKRIVNPSDVSVLERGNEPIVTLITCHPYRVDTMRMIVFAELREDLVS